MFSRLGFGRSANYMPTMQDEDIEYRTIGSLLEHLVWCDVPVESNVSSRRNDRDGDR